MTAFYIINHQSSALRQLEFSDLVQLPSRPNNFLTKKDMLDWAHNAGTDHCFYNFAEPKDPALRVTKENPVSYLYGVVSDFDVQNLEETAVARAVADCPADFPVAYISRTYSRGIRMVWLFERKLPVFTPAIAKAVLTRLAKEMKLKKLAPGFDEPAFIDPAKYFELGTEWRPINPEARIPSSLLTTYAFEASQKVDWKKEGRVIPIEVVAAEVAKRWPGRWSGAFVVGAQGVRFWDPSATNAKGAWIRDSGVQAFTGEARFLHWDEILGKDFVSKFDQNRISQSIENVFFDGRQYWYKDVQGRWMAYSADSMRRLFAVQGLSKEGVKGQPSEVDRALQFCDFNARVDGAFPFLFKDTDRVTVGGRDYLNISRVKATPPAEGTRSWGEQFPWIARYLDGLFKPDNQLDVFLSWHAYFYQSALAKNLRQGQALFIAGPGGAGKTFLSHRIIGASVGGFSEATSFLLGKDGFNGGMFESPVWAVDDAMVQAERRSHELYSQICKKCVANPSMTYRRMYQDGLTLPWIGRLVITLNDDPTSIQMLPNIEGSILDKVIFLLARDPKVNFRGAEAAVAAELPHYLAFLRDYEIPESMKGPDRFGIVSYHHPELIDSAKANSDTAEFSELVEKWRCEYSRTDPDKEFVDLSSLDLLQELNQTESIKEILRQTIRSSTQVARNLNKMIAQGCDWAEMRRTAHGRSFRIWIKPKPPTL